MCYCRMLGNSRPHLQLVHGGVAVEHGLPNFDCPNVDPVVAVRIHKLGDKVKQSISRGLARAPQQSSQPIARAGWVLLLSHQQRACRAGAQKLSQHKCISGAHVCDT